MPKTCLYLLPGLLCDARVWQAQSAALGERYDVRIADFRGESSMTAMAQRVLRDAPSRFAVAGHSMGGRVALRLHALAPERVERLALLDTGVHPTQESEFASRGALLACAEAQGMAALAKRWLPPMLHARHGPASPLYGDLQAMVEAMTPAIFAGQIKALLERPDERPGLGAITLPTLVAAGRQDQWSPPEQHAEIAAAIPGARLEIFEDCGHMAPCEAPEAVTQALEAWLLS